MFLYFEEIYNQIFQEYFYQNIFIENHLLNDFSLILALINTILIFLFFNSEIIVGQISDSTKITDDGFQ